MNHQSVKKLGKNIPEANNSKGFFKSLKNSDFDRTGSLDPLISLAARSSYMRFSKDYRAEDVDKFRDELIKLKEEVNRKRHEMTMMKIEYAKLEEDNNKNVKVIENFLAEAGKNVGEFLLGKTAAATNGMANNSNSNFNGNNANNNEEQLKKTLNEQEAIVSHDVFNQAASMNVSANTFIRLREVYVINNLKKQINQLKKVIAAKDEEIEGFKSNVRCAKYSKLEFNYSNNLNQLIQIKKENETLRNNYEEVSSKYTEQVEENHKFVNSLNKYRTQHDEIKIKNKILEDANIELISKNKYLEEKIAMLNKSIQHQPVQLTKVSLREKNNTINRLKEEIQDLKDKFRVERQRLEKRIFYINEDFKKVKDGLDLKIFKKCETDRITLSLKNDYRQYVDSLQANLKLQAELFENERNQLYDFIEKLSLDFRDIADKNSINVEIPKFVLIPLPIKNEAEAEENNMKELEKRYEQTEQHLIDVLIENEERIKFLSQINIENHLKDFSGTKKTDNGFFLTNNVDNQNEANHNLNNENFASENAEENQNNLNNNAVNNLNTNASHVSKHRLMNLNTEKSQIKIEENENNESKISKRIDEMNSNNNENVNELENQNDLENLNESKYSENRKLAEEENRSQNASKLKNEDGVLQEEKVVEGNDDSILNRSQVDNLEGNSPQFNDEKANEDEAADHLDENLNSNHSMDINEGETKNNFEKADMEGDEGRENIDGEKFKSEGEENNPAEGLVDNDNQHSKHEILEENEKAHTNEIAQNNKDENPEGEENNENIELAGIEGSDKLTENEAINVKTLENRNELENPVNENVDKEHIVSENAENEGERDDAEINNKEMNDIDEANEKQQEQISLNENNEEKAQPGSVADVPDAANSSKLMGDQVNDEVENKLKA